MPLYFESYRTPVDGNGDPYPGAKLYFYDEATVTPKNTYTTRALSVANANPVIADGNGRFGPIWLSTGRYKAVLKTAADVTVYTADGIEGSDAGFGILTTRGDLLTRDATGAIRLPIGANGTVLGSNGTDPGWVVGPSLTTTQTWTATQTFSLSDDGSAAGPQTIWDRVSASPATSDLMGEHVFRGRNSAAAVKDYAKISSVLITPTAGSENGALVVRTLQSGTEVDALSIVAGVYLGAATGGDQGVGKINATGYYLNGVAVLNSGVVAWVYTNSTGTIQSSYNVSSVVLNATGNYTINFTTPLANANYAAVGMGQDVALFAQTTVAFRNGDLHSTTQLQIRTNRYDNAVSCDFSLVVYAG